MVELGQTLRIASPEAMRQFGYELAETLNQGDVLLLHGDLGAGKTTLTQGIAEGLGVKESILSPTFALVAEHQGKSLKLYHLDLYRLEDPEELEGLGYDQFLAPDGVSVIEWPERAGQWLPTRFRLIQIDDLGDGTRVLTIKTVGDPASA